MNSPNLPFQPRPQDVPNWNLLVNIHVHIRFVKKFNCESHEKAVSWKSLSANQKLSLYTTGAVFLLVGNKPDQKTVQLVRLQADLHDEDLSWNHMCGSDCKASLSEAKCAWQCYTAAYHLLLQQLVFHVFWNYGHPPLVLALVGGHMCIPAVLRRVCHRH